MLSVLLIDDEPTVRKGLPLLIDWAALGYKIIDTAGDGFSGLEKIRKLKPDLVITDIRMPGLDGLEMLKAAKAEGLDFYSVILSGFSEFSYAREALSLGAVSYLLKPIDDDELEKLLMDIAEQAVEEKKKNLHGELMAKIFGNDLSGLSAYCQVMDLRIRKGEELMVAIVESWSRRQGLSVQVLGHHGNYHLILLSDQSSPPSLSSLEKMLLASDNGIQQSVIASKWYSTEKELNKIYEEIRQLEEYIFFYPQQFLSSEKLLKDLEATHDLERLEQVKDQLAVSFDEKDAFEGYFSDYWTYFSATPMDEQDIKWVAEQHLQQFAETISQKAGLSKPKELLTNLSIFDATDINQLKQAVRNTYETLRYFFQESLTQEDIIKRLQKYTRLHLSHDLTLKNLAQTFNYNSTYLGKRFRQETGMSYSTYLEEQRMNEAKRLLQNTQMMVYEVAGQVGYGHNVDYFYKRFRRFFNASPNDFRGSEAK